MPADTNGVDDVFVHDRDTGSTTRVGVDSAWDCGGQSISADGRYVAFWSNATNLVAGDTNGWSPWSPWSPGDVFVHDLDTGATARVSVDSSGNEANGGSFATSISAEGRYVVFESDANNLVPNDTNGGDFLNGRDVFAVANPLCLAISDPPTADAGPTSGERGLFSVRESASEGLGGRRR